ncbi:MAG: hypothetical protein FWF34_00450 [Alphaproteobacteria bacterium]|nr:hypothetical protein [Alphaproteobacteria bacterium]MCL2889717.1 hypothetical protein [Alphaproteobacteria bacterium]
MAKAPKKKNIIARWTTSILDVLFRPKQFFSKIVADGNLEESMLKAFLYGLLGGAAVLAMQLIGGATITFSVVFSKLVVVPVLAVAILFVLGGLLMLVAEITGGERDWEIAVKGLASVFFIYPVILIMNALAFNCTSLWIISIIVDLYVLFLLYNIAVYCLRGNRIRVMIVIGALGLFMLTVYMADYRLGWFMIKNTGAALKCLV